MMHTLEADGIHLGFGNRRILSDIYLKCETGKITGLLGRNGEGKTCLMNIIYGSLKNDDKSIRFDTKRMIHAFKRPDLLLYLPQFNFIPKSLTLKRIFQDFNIDFSGFEDLFPEFKSGYRTELNNFSNGQRRLIEIYLIVKSPAQFCMLDEPFTHIMPLHIEKIKEILNKEKQVKGFLITDHMFRSIIDISDSLYVLKNGKTHLTKSVGDIASLGYANT